MNQRLSAWCGPSLALAFLVAGTLGEAIQASSAPVAVTAKTAPKPPVRARTAVGFMSKGTSWAGTWTVSGNRTFGVDLDSHDPSSATGYTVTSARSLRPQVGWTKDHRKGGAAGVRGKPLSRLSLAQLAYLADRYAKSGSPAVAAAADHGVRMLTAGDKTQRRREAARWSAVAKARPAVKTAFTALTTDVRDHAGPYLLTASWATAPTVSVAGALAVQVVSGSGRSVAGIRITGMYKQGAVTATTFSTSTDAKGAAVVKVTASAKGPLIVKIATADLPAALPLLYTPKRFRDRRSPDRLAQRMVGAAPRPVLMASVAATVPPVVPVVTARADPATPVPGSRLTDTITLSGTAPGYSGRIAASLWGPFASPPAAGACDGVQGKLAARVWVDAHGDGGVTSPVATVTDPGYYAWTVDVPGNAVQDEVVTPCGDTSQTFAMAGTPALSIGIAGDPVPGNDVDVTVTTRGTFPGLDAAAVLNLYGPFPSPPTATSCTPVKQADTASATVNGDGTTTATTITAAATGYYTWTLALRAVSNLQTAAAVPCAAPGATFLVSRPDIGPLDVTTTGSVGATDPAGTPPAFGPVLAISSASIRAPLQAVPLNPPGIAVPSDYSVAGQVDSAAHVGDLWGTIVLAGRVGDVHGARGALYGLARVAPGDPITLTDVNGLTATFKVTSVTTPPRTQVLPATLFSQTGPLRLVILTATDPVFFGGGLITYRSHVVVTAAAS